MTQTTDLDARRDTDDRVAHDYADLLEGTPLLAVRPPA